jgi:hypothetical protein
MSAMLKVPNFEFLYMPLDYNTYNRDSVYQIYRDSLSEVVKEHYVKLEAREKSNESIELLTSTQSQNYPESPAHKSNSFDGQTVISSVLLLCLLMLAVVKFRQPVKFRFLLTTFYKGNSVIQPFQDGLIISSASAIIMTINFFLVLSIVAFYSLDRLSVDIAVNMPNQNLITFGILFLVITFSYLIKLASTWATKIAIGEDRGITAFRYNILFFTHQVGILLLPIVFTLTFVQPNLKEYVLFFAYGLIGLLYIYRLVKSILIGINDSVPPLYLFLYLCTLEFLPLVVIIKLLIG